MQILLKFETAATDRDEPTPSDTMKRLLLLVAVTLTLAGCRHSCCNQCSLLNHGCESKAVPVSYNGAVTTYPASLNNGLSTPVAAIPTGGFPVIPPPSANAVELPFPTETIPPTAVRNVGLPK